MKKNIETYDIAVFSNVKDFKEFLDKINEGNKDAWIKPYEIVKVYSNGPNYFFVFYKITTEVEY